MSSSPRRLFWAALVTAVLLLAGGAWWMKRDAEAVGQACIDDCRTLRAPALPQAVEPTPAGTPSPRASPVPAFPTGLQAPLRALTPVIEWCLAESPHPRPARAVTSFRPTSEGGFVDVSVRIEGNADPFVAACVEDAFEEVRFTPSGSEDFQPARWTFRWQ